VANAEVTVDALLLLVVELVEVVVPVKLGSETVVISVPVVVPPAKAAVVTEPVIERDVGVTVEDSGIEADDADDDEVLDPGEEIRVMAKEGLVLPESPNTNIRDPYMRFSFFSRVGFEMGETYRQ